MDDLYGLRDQDGICFEVQVTARTFCQRLNDLRFRRALSHATDRDGIAQAIMKGPFLRPWAGGLYPGAPEFDRKSVV